MTTAKIENAIIKAGQGFHMIQNWPDYAMAFFTTDSDQDYLLRCALHLTEFKKVAETENEIFNEEMDSLLEQLKNHVKIAFQNAINQEEKRLINESKREEKEKSVKVMNSFKSMSKPAPEGTVAELAARYNKSLSEIRKLKRDGLLHTLN
ncbi:MAG: hypothetical protein K2X69_07675 [Silvanigrellaceae bacterium]|nr:hypothetical protein [Silvanigrellaceae bacterium]